MSEEQNTVEDLTGTMTTGLLGNPKEDALFSAEYFKENGPQTFTVKGFIKRRFTDKNGKQDTAWIMEFFEDVPGCKLNMTRQAQLFEIMGTAQIDQIVSRQITLAFDPSVTFGGKKVGGIRLERAEDLAGGE